MATAADRFLMESKIGAASGVAAVGADGKVSTPLPDLYASYVKRGPAPSGTDDTAALNAALTSGKDFVLPPGTYKVNLGALVIPAGVHLRGSGPLTVIQPTGAGVNSLVSLGAGSHVSDLTLDGTGGTSTYLVTIAGDRARLSRCLITNTATYGVHVTSYADVRITDNTFQQVDSYAVLVENAAGRFVFQGNTVTHTTATKGQGITVKVNPGAPTDTRIVGNTVDVFGTIGLEIQGTGATRGTITGNAVHNAAIGISLASANGITVSGNVCSDNPTYGVEAAEATTDSTITGNVILRPGTGIIVSSSAATPACRNVTVSGNTIKSSIRQGIQIEYGSGHVISGNNIDDPGARGIFLNNKPLNCVISGNRIMRQTQPTGTSDAIYFDGVGTLVSGNIIDSLSLTTAAGYGIYSNGGDKAHITGNLVMGGTKAISLIGGTWYSVVGNQTVGTTQHSVYTSGTIGQVFVDAHLFNTAAGSGVDMTGTTNGMVGNVQWTGGGANGLTSGVRVHTVPLTLTNQTVATTAPAAGAAAAVPATPAGYVTVSINGTARQIPYY